MNKLMLIATVVVSVTGCATTAQDTSQAKNSNLTAGVVSASIEKGRTSQAEILEIFGAPNVITTNKKGQEVWFYQKHSKDLNDAKASSGYWFLLGSGGTDSIKN